MHFTSVQTTMRCGACEHLLFDEDTNHFAPKDDPCPKCGSRKKAITSLVVEEMGASDSIPIATLENSIGRVGAVIRENEMTEYAEVDALIKRLDGPVDWDDLVASDITASQLVKECERAAAFGLQGRYFRVRRFPIASPAPSRAALAAPPAGAQKRGRYNDGNERVLYLSRTQETALAETPGEGIPFARAFDLRLDVRTLKLDANLEAEFPRLHYLLLASEYAPHPTARDPYRATHLLREICRRVGVNAIEYPSVRGNYRENRNAVNLVLFDELVDVAHETSLTEPERA